MNRFIGGGGGGGGVAGGGGEFPFPLPIEFLPNTRSISDSTYHPKRIRLKEAERQFLGIINRFLSRTVWALPQEFFKFLPF